MNCGVKEECIDPEADKKDGRNGRCCFWTFATRILVTRVPAYALSAKNTRVPRCAQHGCLIDYATRIVIDASVHVRFFIDVGCWWDPYIVLNTRHTRDTIHPDGWTQFAVRTFVGGEFTLQTHLTFGHTIAMGNVAFCARFTRCLSNTRRESHGAMYTMGGTEWAISVSARGTFAAGAGTIDGRIFSV